MHLNVLGSGSLIGGFVISATGSVALTFRYIGVAAAVAGLIYFLYEFGYVKGYKKIVGSKGLHRDKGNSKKQQKEEKEAKVVLPEPLKDSKISSAVEKLDIMA